MLLTLLGDGMRFLLLCLRSRSALAAENLFLRKQLALYQERHVKPRRATHDHPHGPDLARPLVRLAASLGRGAAGDVDPLASPGVPAVLAVDIPVLDGHRSLADLQALIRQMARENPTWGEERIANELLLKLGLRVSPRTVRKYLPKRLDRGPRLDASVPTPGGNLRPQSCSRPIAACDFMLGGHGDLPFPRRVRRVTAHRTVPQTSFTCT